MRKISKATMAVLEADPRMKVCCLRGFGGCSGRIEWHHNLIYASRQSDIPETILGVCEAHHDQARNTEVREKIDWVMLSLLTPRQMEMLPKAAASLRVRKVYLNKKYGKY